MRRYTEESEQRRREAVGDILSSANASGARSKSRHGMSLKKRSHFLEEPREGGFAFQQHMVMALERNEAGASGCPPRAADPNSKLRLACAGRASQGSAPDLGQKRRHVHIAVGDEVAGGIGGRTAYSLELVEPVGLLLGGSRNELRREHLPDAEFPAPPQPHQSEPWLRRLPSPPRSCTLFPADSITSEQNQMRNAFGMSHRVGDRNRATLRQAVERETIEARASTTASKIADEIFKQTPGTRDPKVRCRGHHIG